MKMSMRQRAGANRTRDFTGGLVAFRRSGRSNSLMKRSPNARITSRRARLSSMRFHPHASPTPETRTNNGAAHHTTLRSLARTTGTAFAKLACGATTPEVETGRYCGWGNPRLSIADATQTRQPGSMSS